MSAAGYGGYVKLHDAWTTDAKIAALLRDGHHDAVCFYLAALAYGHLHGTDGYLSPQAILVVHSSVALGTSDVRRRVIRVLERVALLSKSVANGYQIPSYPQWQTTADQRKRDADRKREARGRPAPRGEERREEEDVRRATARHPSGAADSEPRRAFDVISMEDLKDRASQRIADLERRDKGQDHA